MHLKLSDCATRAAFINRVQRPALNAVSSPSASFGALGKKVSSNMH